MADQPETRPGATAALGKIRLPVWAWAVVAGGGVFLAYRFVKARQAAAAAANSTSSAPSTASTAYPPSTTILGPVDNSAQYGNILSGIQSIQGDLSQPAQPAPQDVYSGEPGFIYQPGDPHILSFVSVGNQQYGVNPLSVNGTWVDQSTFNQRALPALQQAGYSFSPPKGDFARIGGFTRAMGLQGARWISTHSVDSQGNILNTPPGS